MKSERSANDRKEEMTKNRDRVTWFRTFEFRASNFFGFRYSCFPRSRVRFARHLNAGPGAGQTHLAFIEAGLVGDLAGFGLGQFRAADWALMSAAGVASWVRIVSLFSFTCATPPST